VAPDVEVRIERLEASRVAARTHHGPYEGLADVIDEFVRWLKSQREAGGAVTTVFLDPASLEAGVPTPPGEAAGENSNGDGHAEGAAHDPGPDVNAEVWLPWTGGEAPPPDDPYGLENLTIKQVPAAKAACLTHTGHPLGIPHLAVALRGFLQQQGHTPGEETRIVHLMPDWEDPDAWVSEVQIPLESK
jgi:DNA gyrase inhibitor GyrI